MLKPELMERYGEEAVQATIELNKYEEQIEKLKAELKTLYRREAHDRQMKPGQTDTWEDLTYYETVCINPEREAQIKGELNRLNQQKQPYVDIIDKCVNDTQLRQYEEKKAQAAQQVKVRPTEEYQRAHNEAKERYKNLPKFKKAIAVVTGQKDKIRKIAHKLNEMSLKQENLTTDEKEQAYLEAAQQLDSLYGGKRAK